MILPSMTWKEMYDGLEADAQKVQIRIEKFYPKAVKSFKKSRTFPAWYIDEYLIPATNNRYVLFYYAGNISEVEIPYCTSFCVVFSENRRFVIKGMKMGYQHTPASKMIELPQVHAYTSHFFIRYNERFLHKDNLSPNEIAGLFFIRNSFPMPVMMNEDVNKNYKKYGDYNNHGMRVSDGFCFTKTAIEWSESEDGIREHDNVEAMLILYTTFMNESDMTSTQRVAINKEHFKTYMRCVDELRKEIPSTTKNE